MITIARADQPDHQPLIHQIYALRGRAAKTTPRDNHAANDVGIMKEAADLPHSTYILVLCEGGNVIAACRLNKLSQDQIEISRFDFDFDYAGQNGEMFSIDKMVSKIFYALCNLATLVGVKFAVCEYDERFSRILKRIDCATHKVDGSFEINGHSYQRGHFSLDDVLLEKLCLKNQLNKEYLDPIAFAGLV